MSLNDRASATVQRSRERFSLTKKEKPVSIMKKYHAIFMKANSDYLQELIYFLYSYTIFRIITNVSHNLPPTEFPRYVATVFKDSIDLG